MKVGGIRPGLYVDHGGRVVEVLGWDKTEQAVSVREVVSGDTGFRSPDEIVFEHDPSGLRAVMVNGRWPLRVPEHRAVREILEPDHERERLASMHDQLMTGDYIIDVGAEQGDYAALYATWGCEVGLIEANPAAWGNIRATWEANTTGHPVFCCVAFAAERWNADWLASGREWPAAAQVTYGVDQVFLSEAAVEPIVCLDVLTADRRPDAVTIDVEGAELLVLQGARRLLTRRDRPLVWLSLHPYLLSMYGHTPSDVHLLMTEYGYVGQLLGVSHEEHWFYRPEK